MSILVECAEMIKRFAVNSCMRMVNSSEDGEAYSPE